MIKLLNNEERQILTEVFAIEFDSELPNENGHIIAFIEDNKIVYFLCFDYYRITDFVTLIIRINFEFFIVVE